MPGQGREDGPQRGDADPAGQQHHPAAGIGRGERAVRSLGEDAGAGPQLRERLAVVAQVLHGDPQHVGSRRGGQRERVRGPPQRPGQEPPAEELPGLGVQLLEPPAADVDRDDAGCLRLHPDDLETVPAVGEQRDGDPVPQHQDEHRQVHRGPPEPRGQVADERRAVGELVAERQRDRQVGVQVQVSTRSRSAPGGGRRASRRCRCRAAGSRPRSPSARPGTG